MVCVHPACHLPQFLEPRPQPSSEGRRLPEASQQDGCFWGVCDSFPERPVRLCFQKYIHKGRLAPEDSKAQAGVDAQGCARWSP